MHVEDIIPVPVQSYCVSIEDKIESQTYPADLVLGERGEDQGVLGDVANYQPPSHDLTRVVRDNDIERMWIGAKKDKGNYHSVQTTVGTVSGQDMERSSPALVEDLLPEFQKSGSSYQRHYRARTATERMDRSEVIVRPNKNKMETQTPVDISNSFSVLEDIDTNAGKSCGPVFCCDEGKALSFKEPEQNYRNDNFFNCPSVGMAFKRIIDACVKSGNAAVANSVPGGVGLDMNRSG